MTRADDALSRNCITISRYLRGREREREIRIPVLHKYLLEDIHELHRRRSRMRDNRKRIDRKDRKVEGALIAMCYQFNAITAIVPIHATSIEFINPQ